MSTNKNILIIADIPGWAFDKLAQGLKAYCQRWEVEIAYGNAVHNLDRYSEFDLVFYLLDYEPEPILKSQIPVNKLIVGIRSHVLDRGLNFYCNPELLNNRVAAFFVANNFLLKQFNKLHPNVFFAPGGVDTQKYTPAFRKDSISRALPVVGWAGSRSNFGSAYRGLEMLRSACKKVNFNFQPAIREDHWRSQDEMIMYYQNEISIYADLSIKAGRQNGLLEAGSCELPIISTKAGISSELIQHGQNGLLVEHDVNSVADALSKAHQNSTEWGKSIRMEIERHWSWAEQARLFEKHFDAVCELSS